MRCPFCQTAGDKVVDSRSADGGAAIRRRRQCRSCGRRYTTYERIEEAILVVRKRSGGVVPFDRGRIIDGVRKAAANRAAVGEDALEILAAGVEEQMRAAGPEVSSQEVGLAVLDRLRDLDDVAYLRFASVYKGFEGVDDFAREAEALQGPSGARSGTDEHGLEKKTEPKPFPGSPQGGGDR